MLLGRGMKLGFVGGSDAHPYFAGDAALTGVYAETFTLSGIFEAIRARRTFAATDRIRLNVTANGFPMGHIFRVDRIWRVVLPPGLILMTNSIFYGGDSDIDSYLVIYLFLAGGTPPANAAQEAPSVSLTLVAAAEQFHDDTSSKPVGFLRSKLRNLRQRLSRPAVELPQSGPLQLNRLRRATATLLASHKPPTSPLTPLYLRQLSVVVLRV